MNTNNGSIGPTLYLLISGFLIVLAIATIISTPLLAEDYQSVVGSTVGSIVGTALAFLGAVWLWAQEQRKLAADEAAREEKVLAAQLRSKDKEWLREAHANIGRLLAFSYRDSGLDSSSIGLQTRLIEMNLNQNAALIHNDELRAECQFINEMAVESGLEYYFNDRSSRLYTAHGWYLRLINVDEHTSVETARPPHYDRLKDQLDGWYEYRELQLQEQIAHEEEVYRAKAAQGAKDKENK